MLGPTTAPPGTLESPSWTLEKALDSPSAALWMEAMYEERADMMSSLPSPHPWLLSTECHDGRRSGIGLRSSRQHFQPRRRVRQASARWRPCLQAVSARCVERLWARGTGSSSTERTCKRHRRSPRCALLADSLFVLWLEFRYLVSRPSRHARADKAIVVPRTPSSPPYQSLISVRLWLSHGDVVVKCCRRRRESRRIACTGVLQ